MSNGYKQALDRFEKAVIKHHFFRCAHHPGAPDSIQREYEAAKRALISKLQYRKLAAEIRAQKE